MKSLQGSDIETYANELFRFWKLGQAQKNNGVLLLVAPAEHKVRIEVGYGLEGTLTDALSSVIISSAIIPRFKTNDFSGGIERGVDGIISVLSGDTADWQPKVDVRDDDPGAAFSMRCSRSCFSSCHHLRFPVHGRHDARHAVGPLCQARRTHWSSCLIAGSGWGSSCGSGGGGFGGGGVWRRLFRRRRFVGRRRRIGELVMQFSREDHDAVSAAIRDGGDAHLRTDRLRARPRVVGLRLCSDPVGERAGAARAVAAHLFHAVERAADFSVAARGLHRRGPGILVACRCGWRSCRARCGARGRIAPRSSNSSCAGIANTKNRCGVLIFVSLAEHYARIIADEGIAQKVPNAEWQAAIDALTGHMRDGRIAAGFIAAIERCGAVLAAHAPPDGSPNDCRIGFTSCSAYYRERDARTCSHCCHRIRGNCCGACLQERRRPARRAEIRASPAMAVDTELVLAVDVSYSMDPDEQALQREGYVQALMSREFMQALKLGANGRVAVTYFEWANVGDQKILLPWRLIDGPETADAVAAELAAAPYRRASRTSISGGLMFGQSLFAASGYQGLRKVIDVSGDGANNNGPPVTLVRDDVLAKGTTINGLPIMLKKPNLMTMDIEDLDIYYEDCVIGGPGAFVIPIKEREKFTEAIRTKLVQEVAGLTPAPRAVPVAANCAAHLLHHRRAEMARALGQLRRAGDQKPANWLR